MDFTQSELVNPLRELLLASLTPEQIERANHFAKKPIDTSKIRKKTGRVQK